MEKFKILWNVLIKAQRETTWRIIRENQSHIGMGCSTKSTTVGADGPQPFVYGISRAKFSHWQVGAMYMRRVARARPVQIKQFNHASQFVRRRTSTHHPYSEFFL